MSLEGSEPWEAALLVHNIVALIHRASQPLRMNHLPGTDGSGSGGDRTSPDPHKKAFSCRANMIVKQLSPVFCRHFSDF